MEYTHVLMMLRLSFAGEMILTYGYFYIPDPSVD